VFIAAQFVTVDSNINNQQSCDMISGMIFKIQIITL